MNFFIHISNVQIKQLVAALITLFIVQFFVILDARKPQNETIIANNTDALVFTNLKQTITPTQKFNPNNYTKIDWVKLGFTIKQAETILKYKSSLNDFKSANQLQKCYAISSENYEVLEPYLNFKELNKENFQEGKKANNLLVKFNPNTFLKKDWIAIGFSEKQAQTILNYKHSLGGFTKKKQLKKCYAISPEKYLELEPYLNIFSKSIQNKKVLNISKKFNPNKFQLNDWIAIGFSEKQAQTILRYKKSLGRFLNKEQLNKCYAISDKHYKAMSVYIEIPKLNQDEEIKKSEYQLSKFNPNSFTKKQWEAIGFTSKQAQTILNYKKSLYEFSSLKQFQKCYAVSPKKLKELKPFLVFENSKKETKSEFYNLKSFNPNTYKQEDWIKIGFTKRQAQTILKYKKLIKGYKSKTDLGKCYAISTKKLEELTPYLKFDSKN